MFVFDSITIWRNVRLCLVVNVCVCKIWCVRAYCVQFPVNTIKVKSTGHSFRCCYCLIVWDVYLVDTSHLCVCMPNEMETDLKLLRNSLNMFCASQRIRFAFRRMETHTTRKHKRVQHFRLSIVDPRASISIILGNGINVWIKLFRNLNKRIQRCYCKMSNLSYRFDKRLMIWRCVEQEPKQNATKHTHTHTETHAYVRNESQWNTRWTDKKDNTKYLTIITHVVIRKLSWMPNDCK